MLKIDYRDIIESADLEKLSKFFAERKEKIYNLMRKSLKKGTIHFLYSAHIRSSSRPKTKQALS